MANIVLSYNTPTKKIGGIIIDAFLSENYSFENSVTEIPVEDGSEITDNIVEKPMQITIDGFVGQGAFEAVGSVNLDEELKGEFGKKNRWKKAFDELIALKNKRELIDVTTGLDSYSNMAITSISVPRDSENGADLHFSMTLRQLPIVRSKTVQVSVKNVPSAAVMAGAGDQIQSVGQPGLSGKKEADENIYRQEMKRKFDNGEMTAEEYAKLWELDI